MVELQADKGYYDEAIEIVERDIYALYKRGVNIVNQYWKFVYEMDQKLTGWENKSCLQVRCIQEGNSIRIDWCQVKWYGSKTRGNRESFRKQITKPKAAYGYTPSKLRGLAREWEADWVEETERQLSQIRREASHLTKALTYLRHARSAAARL